LASPAAIPRLAIVISPLDEGPKLLRFRHRGFDALMTNERFGLVPEQRDAVLRHAAEFTMTDLCDAYS